MVFDSDGIPIIPPNKRDMRAEMQTDQACTADPASQGPSKSADPHVIPVSADKTSVLAKKARRPHRKSKTGCIVCRKRKIKCDERKPLCRNCDRFGVDCIYQDAAEAPQDDPVDSSSTPSETRRRTTGRPRGSWDLIPAAAAAIASGLSLPRMPTADVVRTPNAGTGQLNLEDLHLLHHFTIHTSPTLASTVKSQQGLGDFWARNVPSIGMTSPFVLHLVLALAARHLLWRGTEDQVTARRYLFLAEYHFYHGISEMSRILPAINQENCGALYLASTLICFCSLAAGPTGPGDLLVYNDAEQPGQGYMSLIRGVRFIRRAVEPKTMFTGLMAPLDRKEEHCQKETCTPTWVSEQIPRIEWVKPLQELKDLIDARPVNDEFKGVCQRSLSRLEAIYEATYGIDSDGAMTVHPKNRFIFIWLYLLEQSFADALHQRHPMALLILAYYAPLLHVLNSRWYLRGWVEQVIWGTRALLTSEYVRYLQWPLEVTSLLTESPSPITIDSQVEP